MKDAPARLKRELDSVLNLQAELDSIQKSLATVGDAIALTSSDHNARARECLSNLQRSHDKTITRVEKLYASLNVPEGFPEIEGLPIEFVRTLLMARDLKINIRKRAIGSFFEWDKLDRAAGGRDQALGMQYSCRITLICLRSLTNITGTKLHQQTRKAIAKRTPALKTAIRKFNTYCDTLERLHKKRWNIPLPARLPTELGTLREDPSLLTDVWITQVSGPTPRWLEDVNVRRGIRAMLANDRCLEERRRLGNEADNLCRWYGQELAAVELAIRTPRCECKKNTRAPDYDRSADVLLIMPAQTRASSSCSSRGEPSSCCFRRDGAHH